MQSCSKESCRLQIFLVKYEYLRSKQLCEDQGIRGKLKKRVCNHVLAILKTYMETRLKLIISEARLFWSQCVLSLVLICRKNPRFIRSNYLKLHFTYNRGFLRSRCCSSKAWFSYSHNCDRQARSG